MSILTLHFYAAVILSLIIYYIIPKRTQWPLLLLLSTGFIYLNGSVKTLAIFFLMVAIAYAGARIVCNQTGKTRSVCCSATVALLAGILFVAKDLEFLNIPLTIIKALSGKGPGRITFPVLQLIGISYFTLSLIGYVLDVHWEKYQPEKNYLKLLLFAGYFPQLTSGPITRFDDMSVQLCAPHRFDANKFIYGAERVIWGCFKKLVLADRAAIFVSSVFDEASAGGQLWLVGTLVYAFLLYTDFSGCMDIVLGISECFQIYLPENFNIPFSSESFGEFWRRWHITMGVWFKEYLLYPLMKTDGFQSISKKLRKKYGKKYGKKLATSLSLGVLWFVIGAWHGGSLKFIVASGMIPGFFLILEEFLEEPVQKLLKKAHVNTECFSWHLICRLRVLLTVCCGWIVIRSGSVYEAFRHIASIFLRFNPWIYHDGTLVQAIDIYDWIILFVGWIMITIVGILHERGIHIRQEFQKQNLIFRWVVLLAALFSIITFGIYGPGYDASSFIYNGF